MEDLFCFFSQKFRCFFQRKENQRKNALYNFQHFTHHKQHRTAQGQKPRQGPHSHPGQGQQPQPSGTGIEHEPPEGQQRQQTEDRVPQVPPAKAAPQGAEDIIDRRQTHAPQQCHAQFRRLGGNGLFHPHQRNRREKKPPSRLSAS